MREPKVTEKLDGRMFIFDDAFEPPELNELVRDVQNWPYLYGEVDDGDLPPTGMSTGEYTGTKTFHALWEFCEKYVPQDLVNGSNIIFSLAFELIIALIPIGVILLIA